MEAKDDIALRGVASTLDNERGVALIVVMVMLLLLTILSITMLASSTSDLKIAGNYRNSTETFDAAEQALLFGQSFGNIFSSITPSQLMWPLPNPTTGAPTGVVYNADMTPSATPNTAPGHDPNSNQIPILDAAGNSTGITADVKVQLLGSGNIPAGSGTQMDSGISPGSGNFKANTYAVNVKAFGKNGTQAELESQVAKIVQQ